MKLVTGKLVTGHSISKPNGPPGPGCKLLFYVHGRKNQILVDQSLILELNDSRSNGNGNGNGFDMIEEVSLTIGNNVIETHTGQLLKDLSNNNGSSNGIRFTIPLHFFYCRSKTPLVLDALYYSEVDIRVKLGNYEVTRCELDSTIVTAECAIRDPGVAKIRIITDKYPETEYEDFIVAGNNVYYLIEKTVEYYLGRLLEQN